MSTPQRIGYRNGELVTERGSRVRFALSRALVIPAIHFLSDHGELRTGRADWIGPPREPDGRHFHVRLQTAFGPRTQESKLLRWILVAYCFAGRSPNHLEAHSSGGCTRVQSGPARLIHNGNIGHFERQCLVVGACFQSVNRNGNHPIKSGRRYRRMQVVNLVGRDRRSLK